MLFRSLELYDRVSTDLLEALAEEETIFFYGVCGKKHTLTDPASGALEH